MNRRSLRDIFFIPALATIGMLTAPQAGAQSSAERLAAEEMQRCVWRCLADSPGAASRQYQQCVAAQCDESAMIDQFRGQNRGQAPQQPRAQTTAGRWTNHSTANGAGHSAAIEAGGRSFNYICERRGRALIGVAGLGGNANGVGLRVDRQAFRLPFVMQNGILYTTADSGSALVQALMNGNTVEVTNSRGAKASFPLRGSGAAIRKAMAACGLRP